MKLLLVGDIHFGQDSPSSTHPGVVRLSSSQALPAVQKLLTIINQQQFDQIIWMGDYIREAANPETDRQHLESILHEISQCQPDAIHLIGNHDQRALSENIVADCFLHNNIQPQFWGQKQVADWQLIWIDTPIDSHRTVSEPRLQWLDEQLSSNGQTIFFSHYSVMPIDGTGSFYFENEPEAMQYTNGQEVAQILGKHHVPLAINAHTHMVSSQNQNNTWFLTAPAFSEKIASDHQSDFHPGIYSILEIDQGQFTFSSYSWEFCFAKVQGKFG